MRNYIFVYGSLVNTRSRENNNIFVKTYPVEVRGVKRGWFLPIPEDETTALGLIQKNSYSVNGLLFEVFPIDIEVLDKREKIHRYERVKIKYHDVKFINSEQRIERESVIWTYTTESPQYPTKTTPIAQSYVDVVIQGFSEHGEGFALDFVNTTDGWDKAWINDRESPRYRRNLSNINYSTIDTVLHNVIKYRLEFQ
jgi:gamma-glutamylcyclotransferase (GGCT)/AIG2-like uncharacterized protein YtfP